MGRRNFRDEGNESGPDAAQYTPWRDAVVADGSQRSIAVEKGWEDAQADGGRDGSDDNAMT